MDKCSAIMDRIDVRQLERSFRAECKPIIDEMVRVHATTLRPMFFCDGMITYGPFPPEAQAYLDLLQQEFNDTADRYKQLAATSSFSSR